MSCVVDVTTPTAPDDAGPRIIVLVRLDEGPCMTTNIVSAEVRSPELPLGAKVRVEFRPAGAEILPVFRLLGD